MLSRLKAKLTASWGFDSFEQEILNSATTRTRTSDSRLLVQIPPDHYFLALYIQVIKKFVAETNGEIVGIWPAIFTARLKRDLLFPIRLAYDILNYYLTRRKWLRLWKAAGIDRVIIVDDAPLASKLTSWLNAWRTWNRVRTKQDVIDISIDGVYCGDLIYDTYLRYRLRPTGKVGSLAMLYYIYKAHVIVHKAKELGQEKNVQAFFTTYSTYIHHGIPVRFLLQQGVAVYASGNFQQKFKKLTPDDHFHTANHSNYKTRFDALDHRDQRIAEGTAALEKKFSGAIDKATVYMKTSAYSSGTAATLDPNLEFDGILFLHDFYDSPHIYSSMLFPDFYEWVLHTVELIEKNNLRVLVKPHPNQVADSSTVIEKLKERFPTLQWINPRVSNAVLLKSGARFGISLYGTILHELAYHGIVAICAGDNPHTSFTFVQYPKTVEEYDWMILNHASLKMPEDFRQQVAAFYYMHNAHQKDDYTVNTDVMQGYNVFNCNSELACKSMRAPYVSR